MSKICCAVCGKTEALQRHHICYEPEMVIWLCKDCHIKVHKHGTGSPAKVRKIKTFRKSITQHPPPPLLWDELTKIDLIHRDLVYENLKKWFQKHQKKFLRILHVFVDSQKRWNKIIQKFAVSKATVSVWLKWLQWIGAIEKYRDDDGFIKYGITGIGQELLKDSNIFNKMLYLSLYS